MFLIVNGDIMEKLENIKQSWGEELNQYWREILFEVCGCSESDKNNELCFCCSKSIEKIEKKQTSN